MGFFGCRFCYAGVPSYEYGIMMYDIGDANEDGTFSSAAEIKEDRTSHRYTPLFYGVTNNQPLTFSLTLGADLDSIEKHMPIDRWDFDAISTWLTMHDRYEYLEIYQPDMEAVRFKCIITNLEYTTYGKLPWALTCQVTCDSPYAYLWPEEHNFDVKGAYDSYTLECRAACMYYRPKLTLTIADMHDNGSIAIYNHIGEPEVSGISFSGLPTNLKDVTIQIDNENEIVTCDKINNMYQYAIFNIPLLRFNRGYNTLYFLLNGNVSFTCEYPINVGG